MKSSALLATFSFILLIKFIDGQQNGLVRNFENVNHVSKQQPIQTISDTFQRFLNQNGNTGPLLNGINQHQTPKQTNTPHLPQSLQQIQLPPDLQPQPLQVQQHLQLQKSLPLELQLQKQPIIQSQQSLKSLPQNQIDLTVQSQKPLQLQAQLQPQPVMQAQPQLHPQQTLQIHQTLQSKHPLPSSPQQRLQEPVNFPQNIPQPLITSDNINFVEPSVPHNINYQPDLQIPAKWKSTNTHNTINVDNPSHMQILKIQPQQNYVIQPAELISSTQKLCDKNQEVLSLGYVSASQQAIPPVLSASVPAFSKGHSIAILPQEGIKPVISVPVSPSILTVPSPPIHTTNTQTYYHNHQASNPGQNTYISQNTGTHYAQNPSYPITILQSLPTASVPSQSSILSSIPYSALQVPSVSYPANVAPTYTSKKSEPTNLKSLLPLIFNLLREKIASCECQNGCPCKCKNKNSKNELEVLSGYSNQKHYGALNDDLSVINPLSEESEVTKCPRERKNCGEIIKESDECQEGEDPDEDEADEDELDEED